MSDKFLTCADCDELLLDYFEGDLDDSGRAQVDAHASSCARCQGLIRDVNGITTAASNLPDLAPSRDLWAGIESRIQPDVVPLGQPRRGMHLSHRLVGIAAAALVVISSSVTYVVTRPVDKKTARVSAQPRDIHAPAGNNEVVSPPANASPRQSEVASASSAQEAPSYSSPANSGETSPVRRGGSSSRSTVTQVKNMPRTAAEAALAPEIEQLEGVLESRRGQLDPSTVKIVEDNLALIDAAVKQARAALQRDPASGFVTERLDNALQKKVELLRTVALLPSRS